LRKIQETNLPSNIQVHVRVRPLIKNELITSPKKSVAITNSRQILCGADREFNFDMVYSEESGQQEIFDNSIKANLERSLEGYNFSTFAYGQTV
jgi:hypothetical protein